MKVFVCDTSVLSSLALIDRLALLAELFGEVTVPEAVLGECLHPDAPEPLRSALAPSPPPFIRVQAAGPLLAETTSLDPGEVEAITLAWQHRGDCLLLMDEKRGRAIAASLGLPVRGQLGVVIEAHRRGLDDFDTLLERLKSHRFRIADALIAQARQRLRLI